MSEQSDGAVKRATRRSGPRARGDAAQGGAGPDARAPGSTPATATAGGAGAGTAASLGDTAPDAVARVWAVMCSMVLTQDRRTEVAETLGMTFFRAKALRHLLPGPLTMRELTSRLSTEKPYTTLIVDDLEKRGYVARSAHPDDRRSKIVALTPAGVAAAEQAERILARPPPALLALTPDELAALDRIMAKLHSPRA